MLRSGLYVKRDWVVPSPGRVVYADAVMHELLGLLAIRLMFSVRWPNLRWPNHVTFVQLAPEILRNVLSVVTIRANPMRPH